MKHKIRFYGIVVTLMLHFSCANAQETYADSARSFLRFFMQEHGKLDTGYVVNCTNFIRIDSNYISEPIASYKKLKKFEVKRQFGGTSTLKFDEKEIKYIIHEISHPRIAKWDRSYFTNCRLVRRGTVDSFFDEYFARLSALSDENSKGMSYDEKHKAYEELEKVHNKPLGKKGFGKIYPPVFLKGGTVAVIAYWSYWGNMYITYKVELYQNTATGWEYFATVMSGNIN